MKRISKNTMEKKDIFAPLATGLGATRRAAMLLLVMMLTMAQTAWAQGGSCGNHVTWSLAAHTLTISGEGNMWDYDDVMNTAPWNSYAEQIQEVVIENGVTSIGAYAFSSCYGLESVTFAEGSELTSIGERAFYATGLTSIEIPASVTSIGEYAFDVTGLTSIEIPASVTSIGGGAFSTCSKLTTMTVEAGNTVYDSRDNCNAIIEKSSNTLIAGCKNTTIPAGVMSIGNYAFYGCSDLTSIDIPAGVTSIGAAAFGGRIDLSTVTFAPGSQLTTIGEGAFSDCIGLGSITIPASVTSIGKEVFTYCSNLSTITVEDGNTVYDSRDGCNAIIETSSNKLIAGCKNSTIPDGVTSIGDNAFDGHGPATVTIPASVTTIGAAAFEASGLTTVTFDGTPTLTTIGENAFHDNPLGSITIPASVTSIGSTAFYDCPKLGSVTFAEGSRLESIGDNAFDGHGLTSINIPASVTSIGDNAFHDCSGLKRLMLNGEATIGWDAFPYGATVTIAEGMLLHNGTEPLSGNVSDMDMLNGKTLKTAYSVTFDIADDDDDPEAQIVVRGNKATVPTVARTGYTLKWKLNEEDYDFDTPVNSNIALTAVWTANNYTVQFSANGGSGDAMAPMQLTYDGDEAMLPACTYTAPDGKVFKNWNTAADGSGTPYDDERWVRNLTGEANGTVVLYAQWGKNIAACNITVPNQTLDDYTAVSYKFEAANSGNVETGTTVYDGETLLTLGTDYRFGNVTMANGDPIDWMGSNIGDECKVEIIGIGNYGGSKWKTFKIVVPDAGGTWGDNGELTWAFHDGTLTISPTENVQTPVAMKKAAKGEYPWFSVANYIQTITIEEGVSTVADDAFNRVVESNVYGNVNALHLPSTLTTIGEYAFAYCTGLTVELKDFAGITYPANAFTQVGCVVGTLLDNANNANTISVMAQASKNNVTLTGRTLYKDGDWNTLCLPFDVREGNSILEGATVKELDVEKYYDANGEFYTELDYENAFRTGFDAETGTLRLYFKNVEADGSGVVLQAGTPYLIKWDKAEGYDDADPATRDITGDHVFWNAKLLSLPKNAISYDHNVTFIGNYSPETLTGGDASNLYLGANNQLYWPSADRTINAFRGYFHVNLSGAGQVRSIRLNLGDKVTGVTLIDNGQLTIDNYAGADSWYDLQGRKLNFKPTQKGVYIYKGKKVVIDF